MKNDEIESQLIYAHATLKIIIVEYSEPISQQGVLF